MRVAGLGYSDGARNLEVMLESLSGGRRREIQEDGIVMEVKIFLFKCSRRSWREMNWVLNASALWGRRHNKVKASSLIVVYSITCEALQYQRMQTVGTPDVFQKCDQEIWSSLISFHSFSQPSKMILMSFRQTIIWRLWLSTVSG